MEPRAKRKLKLTDEQVVELRAFAKTGLYSNRAIANFYGVSAPYVTKIINGEKRTHDIDARRQDTRVYKRGIEHHRAKLTDDEVDEIRTLGETGKYSYAAIAKHYKVSRSHVVNIIKGCARPAN